MLDFQRASGTLIATPNTVILTVTDGYTVRVFAVFANTGATDRIVTITLNGKVVFTGDATNSPLKAGQTLEIDLKLRLNAGETIAAWQSSGADVDYFVTVAVVPS